MNIKRPASFFSRSAGILAAFCLVVLFSLYTVAAQEYESSVEGDFHSDFDAQITDQSVLVEWIEGDKHLVRDNEKYFVIERGVERAMTQEERLDLEQRYEKSQQKHAAYQATKDRRKREIHQQKERQLIQHQQPSAGDIILSSEALAHAAQESANQQQRLLKAKQKIDHALEELSSSVQQNEISEASKASVERGLLNAQRKIAHEHRRLQRESERAKSQIKLIEDTIERANQRAFVKPIGSVGEV